MPTVTIRDRLNVETVSASPHISWGLGKYLKGQSASLLAGVDVVRQLRTPLHLANVGESGLGLTWSGDVAFGESGTALTIEAGAKAVIGVLNRTGMEVFDSRFVGEPIEVRAGTALVSFSFRPSLALGLKRQVGTLSFGFSAGGAADFAYFHPFDLLTGPTLSVGEASRTVLERFVVPNTAEDLRRMRDLPEGALAAVGGHGQLRIAAILNVAAVFNPLASVDGISKLGPLTLSGAATAMVGVKAMVTGDFQIRVQKMASSVIRLSYHKVAGRELEISLSASAGLGVSLGDRELLGMLFKGPGGLPGASREDLVQGGITSKQLDRVAAAMKAALSRKIELAIAASFSSSALDEAAFLYEIDLDALDEEGADALDSALAGDLSLIDAIDGDDVAHGIRVLHSRTRSIRKKQLAWRINLVGIVNVPSMSELIKSGSVTHDPESAELVIVDKLTSDRVGAITTNKQIRKLLYESTVMSLTYRAIGLDPTTAVLGISQSFFFFDKSANRQRVSGYLDAVRALGLIGHDGDTRLGDEDDFGQASLLLETSFDDEASVRLFVSPQGIPDSSFYERIGREALLSLIKVGESDDYRRIPLLDDKLWKNMRDTAQPGFRFIVPPPITGGSSAAFRLGVIESDFTVIVWWAGAMAKAAERLAEMRAFLSRQPDRRDPTDNRLPPELDQNQEFLSLRRDLEEVMVKAIRNNNCTFDDPWGLIALHRASAGTARAAATLISPKLTLFLSESTEEITEAIRAHPPHLSARLEHEALQSLASVNGLEPLEDVCRRYDVQLSARGSVVRRLVESPDASVFEAARFLSDLDLVHTGSADRTEEIKAAILTEVPFGETLRLQLRSEAEDERFRIAAAHSGIIPAATLRLSTAGGLHDPWGGVQDIIGTRYRYIKNGFFNDSPLYRTGRDLDLLSALLYFRIILEPATSLVADQPGLDDASRVIDETVASDEALGMVRRNPVLCARLVYFLLGLKAARPAEMHANHDIYSGLGLDRLAAYFSDYAVLSDAFSQVFRPLTLGSSLVASEYLTGAQFRFDFSPQLPWTHDTGEIWDQLSSAVNAFRGADVSAGLSPPTIDNGLIAVAASPALRMRRGRSPSSGNADGSAGVHEFVHFIVKVEPWCDLAVTGAPENLSVIVAVQEKNKVRWVTTVPSYCRFEAHENGTYLFVRCNIGGIGQAIIDGALQVFVLGWNGRESELRRL